MKNKNKKFINYHTIMINNKINKFGKSIIVYNEENATLQILSNTFKDRSTEKLKYKEHIIIECNDSRTSLTSSEEVMYLEKINGQYAKK
jgi:hypothetical protein